MKEPYQNRIPSLFRNLLFLIGLLAGFGSLFGRDALRVRSLDLGGIQWNLDETLLGIHRKSFLDLQDSMKALDARFDHPVLEKPVILWMVSRPEHLKLVVRSGMNTDQPVPEGAGSLRKENEIALVVSPDASLDYVRDLVLTEYARSLMDAFAPSAAHYRIGWFYAGCPVVEGWTAHAEASGESIPEAESRLENYYGFHLDPDHPVSLSSLELPEDWEKNAKSRPAEVQAQAVLACLTLVRKKGMGVIPSILAAYEESDVFETAFHRVTDMDLEEFEKELLNHTYPEIKNGYAKGK